LIRLDDLGNYAAVERKVLEGQYRGYKILTAPPPSSGGIGILQMMGVLEKSGYEKHGAGSASAIHFVAETMRRYYADRAEFLGDPDFEKIPVAGLLAPRYLEKLRASIDPDGRPPAMPLGTAIPQDTKVPRRRTFQSSTRKATRSPSLTPSTAATAVA